MRNKAYDFRTGFIDLLLCALAAVLVVYIISTALINVTKVVKTEGIRKNAEYIIEINWPQNLDCDVDLWLSDPGDITASYQRKDIGLMHLERDDLGHANDTVVEGGNTFKSKFNGEIMTIRGIIPGKWSSSIHLYACRVDGKSPEPGTKMKLDVQFKITKINPNLVIVYESVEHFDYIFEEIPVVNWTMNNLGYPVDWDETPNKIIKIKKEERASPYQ
jgi:hypothetical protein